MHALLLLIVFGGGYLLYETGEHGAEMVFCYGVGVQQSETKPTSVEPGLTIGRTGRRWQPQSDTAWTKRMTWLEGRASDVEASLDTTDAGRVALTLRPSAPITFVVPDTLGAVHVAAELDWDGFDGTASLLHHVQGPQAYDFLVIEGSTMRLGHVVDGERSTFATETAHGEDWQRIRGMGDGALFRDYVDGAMVGHGHGEVASTGAVGLRLDR